MCTGAPAPAITAPSIPVVRKMRLPETIGEECPRPGMGDFQSTFLAELHSSGKFFSSEIPLPAGPRHCGQSAAWQHSVERRIAMLVRLLLIGIDHLLGRLRQPEAANESRDINEQLDDSRGI